MQNDSQHEGAKDYFTAAEVAQELRISTKTVRELIKHEGLPAYKFGRKFRIPAAEFAEWRESMRVTSVEKTSKEAS